MIFNSNLYYSQDKVCFCVCVCVCLYEKCNLNNTHCSSLQTVLIRAINSSGWANCSSRLGNLSKRLCLLDMFRLDILKEPRILVGSIQNLTSDTTHLYWIIVMWLLRKFLDTSTQILYVCCCGKCAITKCSSNYSSMKMEPFATHWCYHPVSHRGNLHFPVSLPTIPLFACTVTKSPLTSLIWNIMSNISWIWRKQTKKKSPIGDYSTRQIQTPTWWKVWVPLIGPLSSLGWKPIAPCFKPILLEAVLDMIQVDIVPTVGKITCALLHEYSARILMTACLTCLESLTVRLWFYSYPRISSV